MNMQQKMMVIVTNIIEYYGPVIMISALNTSSLPQSQFYMRKLRLRSNLLEITLIVGARAWP